MYQSIQSIPQGKPPRNFFERADSLTPGHKKVRNPDPWGRKLVLEPHPRAIIFKNPEKTKHEMEIMKNSPEILICLEIFKQ